MGTVNFPRQILSAVGEAWIYTVCRTLVFWSQLQAGGARCLQIHRVDDALT